MADEAKNTEIETATEEQIEVGEATDIEAGKGPLATLADIEKEVERSFARLLGSNLFKPSLWELPDLPAIKDAFEAKLPKVDIIDHDHEIVVEAELPGVKKSDLDVSIGEDSVTIKANSETRSGEDGEFHRREIQRSFTSRTLSLPSLVDAGQAKAKFKDGLLKITLPKTEGNKRHTISID